MTCNITKYYLGNQINVDEMDGARGTCGGGDTYRVWLENLAECDNLEYLNGEGYESVDWVQLAQDKEK